ncbi:MAG TPA: hypothetical protein VGD23_10155 [Sphingomicrobium sp.]
MAYKQLFVAIGMIVAAAPVSATQSDPAPAIAPPGDANTRYCLRIEAVTGSRLEEVKCWTRAEWAEQDVDVDKEWAKEGVKVIA